MKGCVQEASLINPHKHRTVVIEMPIRGRKKRSPILLSRTDEDDPPLCDSVVRVVRLIGGK